MKHLFLSFILVAMTSALFAQEISWPKMDPSPMDMATYPRSAAFTNYLEADDPDRSPKIKVIYSRPYKKDRVIFGDLVKYGEDWRLGANQGTEVVFYQAVELGGVTVPRGRYRVLAEVNKDHWDIVLSKHLFTSGARDIDKTKEVGRFTAKTSATNSVREQFTIGFQKVNEGHVDMLFEWDNTRATLPINLNAASIAGEDASPMDMASYPSRSTLQNFLKPEEVAANEPKIRVVYSRPQMKGRKIFGELLAYGELWRLGANETTTVTFYTNVTVGDIDLRAGTYGLFAVVNQDSWDIVIHSKLDTWGSANHDESANIGTVKVPVEKNTETLEAFTTTFDDVGDNKVHMLFGWENSMVRVPITLK